VDCSICGSKLKAGWTPCEATPIPDSFKTTAEFKFWSGQVKPLIPIFLCPHGCYTTIPITTKKELQQWVEDVVLENREETPKKFERNVL